jgi:hypothetical protein
MVRRLRRDGWHANWEAKMNAIIRHGLPVKVRDVDISADGFISLRMDVDELLLPRNHKARQFGLHLSLGFKSDYGKGVAEDAVRRLRNKYAGEWLPLRMAYYTSGDAVVLADDDVLATDDDISWLHSRGSYWKRPVHISL